MRVSVVTGCYGGIGSAITAALRQNGDHVIGIDRAPALRHVTSDMAALSRPVSAEPASPEPASPKPASPEPASPAPALTPPASPTKDTDLAPQSFFACDLSDMEATAATARSILDQGPVGCLVNCAGHYAIGDVFDITLADFDMALAVNLRAPFVLSQAFGRSMRQSGGGCIVNIASIAAHIGSPMVPYGASKAGIVGLTKSLARVMAPHGIRVNAVAPGITRTAMAEGVDPDQMARQIENVAQKRWGEPEEIAQVVRFLASDGASYMSGAVVDVTGGWIT